MLKVFNFRTFNLGDFFNSIPVIAGLANSFNETIFLVLPDKFKEYKGIREFLEYQPTFSSVAFESEIYNMNIADYILLSYCDNEYKDLLERPGRPIETLRHEMFIRQISAPNLGGWEVDDSFTFKVPAVEIYDNLWTPEKIIIGDRWSKVTDKRRADNIFKDVSEFQDTNKYYWLDYENNIATNAYMIQNSNKPFIGTFTGAGMLADLLCVPNICVYDSSMYPFWDGMPPVYSYWKHYYKNRPNQLLAMENLKQFLNTLDKSNNSYIINETSNV